MLFETMVVILKISQTDKHNVRVSALSSLFLPLVFCTVSALIFTMSHVSAAKYTIYDCEIFDFETSSLILQT